LELVKTGGEGGKGGKSEIVNVEEAENMWWKVEGRNEKVKCRS